MSAPAGNPFRGLAPFEDSDADAALFFGRAREAEIAIANVFAARLTVLHGPSGVGKSSLARAGVAHALRVQARAALAAGRRAGCGVVTFAGWQDADPAAALIGQLAAQLTELVEEPPPVTGGLADVAEAWAAVLDGDVVLILDQFEEFFTYHSADGDGFVEQLFELLRRRVPVNVLMVVRDDALARLDRFAGRTPSPFGNLLMLERLDAGAGREAMEAPLAQAARGPSALAPGLAERVLDEVAAGRIGTGIEGRGGTQEPSGRVEAPYLQLVMQRLWDEEAAGGSETLRVETLERLGGADRIVEEHLTGALAGLSESDRDAASRIFQQLVTPTGAKIAHEAGDLAGYAGLPRDATERLLHELSDQRILRPLGRGDAKDERYEIFHDVLAPATLAWRAQHEAERRLAGEREAARRRHRRLAALAGSALTALAVLAVVAAYALSQRSDAEANAREARARALGSQALALRATDPEQSLRLALAAAESVPGRESERVLRASLLAARTQTVIDTGVPLVAAGEAHGELIAEGADGTSLRIDAAAGRATERDAAAGRTRAAQVGAGGAIVTSTDGTVAVDRRPIDGVADADRAALSRDGRRAGIVHGNDVVIVSVPGGRELRTLEHPSRVSAVAFVAGGTIATGDVDGVIRLWGARDAPPRLLEGHAADTRIFSLASSPDGSLIASGGADGTARVWEVESGDLVAVLSAHDNFVDAVAFSPDAKHLATGSTDHTARIWQIADSHPLIVLAGHRGAVRSVAYTSAAGLLTASSDGTLRLWDATPEPELRPDRRSAVRPAPPRQRAVGPDGSVATIAGREVNVVRPDGTRFRLQGHADDVTSVAFSRDGRSIVTASLDHIARIWDTASGRLVQPLTGHFGSIRDARFSPDGRWVVTAGPTKVGLWDAETGQRVTYIAGPGGRLTSVAFGDDGRTIAAVTADGAVGTFECTFCGGLDSLTALARKRLQTTGRALPPEERARYLGR